MIVQAIGLLDDLDKELNTYAMRVREWYGWHFPEMTRVVTDNIQYALAVSGGGSIRGVPGSSCAEFEDSAGSFAAVQVVQWSRVQPGAANGRGTACRMHERCFAITHCGSHPPRRPATTEHAEQRSTSHRRQTA